MPSSGSHQRRHPLQVRGVQGVLIHRNAGVQQAQQLLVHVHQGGLMDLRGEVGPVNPFWWTTVRWALKMMDLPYTELIV